MYTTLYPFLYIAVMLIKVDAIETVQRLDPANFIITVCVLVFLRNRSEVVRLLGICAAFIIIFSSLFNDYRSVVGEEMGVNELDYVVSEGTFKGIVTTEEKGQDIKEGSEYLDLLVGDSYYQLRDRLCIGYLLAENGKMCANSSWDSTQYGTDKYKNNMAQIENYYSRTGIIPDMILYLGNETSIDAPDFEYNDFVNSKYKLTLDDKDAPNIFGNRVRVYSLQK